MHVLRSSIFVTLLLGATAIGLAQDSGRKTVTNPKWGFSISYPAAWTAKEVQHPDPLPDIEEFKAGKVTLGGGISTSTGDEPDPNAVAFNQVQESPATLPSVIVYAHEKKPRTFDEFSKDLEQWTQMFRMKIASSGKVALDSHEGYDFTYGEGMMRTRLVIIFANGKRYGITTADFGTGNFDKYTEVFDELVKSFQVLK